MSVVTIPDIWIAGYMRTHPDASLEDAVNAFHETPSCNHDGKPEICIRIPRDERCERCLLRIR